MEWFDKALDMTIKVGFGAMGFFVGLMLLRITIEVAGFMLGSSLGTLIFAWFVYGAYKRYRKRHPEM